MKAKTENHSFSTLYNCKPDSFSSVDYDSSHNSFIALIKGKIHLIQITTTDYNTKSAISFPIDEENYTYCHLTALGLVKQNTKGEIYLGEQVLFPLQLIEERVVDSLSEKGDSGTYIWVITNSFKLYQYELINGAFSCQRSIDLPWIIDIWPNFTFASSIYKDILFYRTGTKVATINKFTLQQITIVPIPYGLCSDRCSLTVAEINNDKYILYNSSRKIYKIPCDNYETIKHFKIDKEIFYESRDVNNEVIYICPLSNNYIAIGLFSGEVYLCNIFKNVLKYFAYVNNFESKYQIYSNNNYLYVITTNKILYSDLGSLNF